MSLRAGSLACHCERSEAISVLSLGINSAISGDSVGRLAVTEKRIVLRNLDYYKKK